MKHFCLRIEISSYWHAGSGYGEGAYLDAVVKKTPSGLPIIPGKTIKGLLREAAQLAYECGQITLGEIEYYFGTRDATISRFETKEGALHFSDATLGDTMEDWAASASGSKTEESGQIGMVQFLYREVPSTAINDIGTAKENTLRIIEVTVPLELQAAILSPTQEGNETQTDVDRAFLRRIVPLVRQLGSHRHRGLGRAKFTIEEVCS